MMPFLQEQISHSENIDLLNYTVPAKDEPLSSTQTVRGRALLSSQLVLVAENGSPQLHFFQFLVSHTVYNLLPNANMFLCA